ncbi:DUF5959 family protein [Streptomyces sp. NPDC047130]|uniref:DUF5959 family protein n=1 Tax=Streptomyces sp. NPDC047130 TaxID=3155261 RepID=UPI0033D006DD
MTDNSAAGRTELIRLADATQSISIQLRSTTPSHHSAGTLYYDADVVVTSDFVSGSVYLGFDSQDLVHLGQLLVLLQESDEEFDPDDPFMADWPSEGRTAYLRLIGEDPFVVEVHDGTGSQVVVAMCLDLHEDWLTEARQRLEEARAALGVPQP